METLAQMRKETPSPDSVARIEDHHMALRQLKAKVNVYMEAEDLNDIPSVSYFKGLQDFEVLS